MEVIERKENKLLNRVEISFRWNHTGTSTPSRTDMLNAIASVEPGSKSDLIVVKNVQTRFGVGQTTGLGIVYNSAEAMSVEPKYIRERFGGSDSGESEDAPEADVSGGEE